MIYTTDEIISKKFYTDDCEWIDVDILKDIINDCPDVYGFISKEKLLEKLSIKTKHL